MKRFAILGAGITGLTLAYYLSRAHHDCKVVVFDKAKTPGGVIQTMKAPFFFEKGPRTFMASRCLDLLKLIEELDLEDEVIYSSKESQKRYLFYENKLHSPLKTKGILKALFTEWAKPSSNSQDESVYDFFHRRVGENVTNTLIDPFVTGIFAADIKNLSMQMAFPYLFHFEKYYGSCTKGYLLTHSRSKNKGLFTLKSGMQTLIDRLQNLVDIHFEKDVSAIFHKDFVTLQYGDQLDDFDHLFITSSFEDCKHLFPKESFEMPMSDLVTVNVAYKSYKMPHKGFGYLVPSFEKSIVLGAIFDSNVFPQQSNSFEELRMTFMLGGAHHREIISYSDGQMYELVQQALKNHLGIQKTADFMQITKYPKAIAQYPVGAKSAIASFLEEMKEKYPRVTFCSKTFGSPAVNTRVAQAKEMSFIN